MIKRIVFDIDQTLLNSKKDCLESYKTYFERKNLPDYSEFLYELIGEYDRQNGNYVVLDLVSFIDKNSPFTFSVDDFKELYNIYKDHATKIEDDIEDALSKLSQKYELVILTNWYYEDQVARLEKAGILKYFKKVYAYENAGLKPHKEAYETACNGLLLSECLMIGDSIEKDVSVPLSFGMHAILYNPNSIQTEYKSINKMSDLLKEEIL